MSNRTLAEFLGAAFQLVRASSSLLWLGEARLKGVHLEGRIQLIGRPLLSVAANSRMLWQDGVKIASSLRANPLGCFQPCVLRTLAPGAELTLGERVGLSGAVICAGRSIEIGEGTIIGSGAMILDNDFHVPAGTWGWENEVQKNARPIQIGRGVFIGARAILLKGVRVGDRAVIGAGAVVTHDVEAGQTVAGNPARIVSRHEKRNES